MGQRLCEVQPETGNADDGKNPKRKTNCTGISASEAPAPPCPLSLWSPRFYNMVSGHERFLVRHYSRTRALTKGRGWCLLHLGLGILAHLPPRGPSWPSASRASADWKGSCLVVPKPSGGPGLKEASLISPREACSSGRAGGTGYRPGLPCHWGAEPPRRMQCLPAALIAGAVGPQLLEVCVSVGGGAGAPTGASGGALPISGPPTQKPGDHRSSDPTGVLVHKDAGDHCLLWPQRHAMDCTSRTPPPGPLMTHPAQEASHATFPDLTWHLPVHSFKVKTSFKNDNKQHPVTK